MWDLPTMVIKFVYAIEVCVDNLQVDIDLFFEYFTELLVFLLSAEWIKSCYLSSSRSSNIGRVSSAIFYLLWT